MPLTSQAFRWEHTCLVLAPSCSHPSSKILPRCLPPSPYSPIVDTSTPLLRKVSPRMLSEPATEAQPAHTAAMLLSLPCLHPPRTLWAGWTLTCLCRVPAGQDGTWCSAHFGQHAGDPAECKRWFQLGKETPTDTGKSPQNIQFKVPRQKAHRSPRPSRIRAPRGDSQSVGCMAGQALFAAIREPMHPRSPPRLNQL